MAAAKSRVGILNLSARLSQTLVQEVLLQADVSMQIPAVAPHMCSAWRSRRGRGVCTAPWPPGERTGGHCPWRDTDFCSTAAGPQPQSGFSKTAGQRDQPFRVDFVETLDVQQRGRQMKKQLRSRRRNCKAGSVTLGLSLFICKMGATVLIPSGSRR